MADYQIIPPKHPLLTQYIDHYMYVCGDSAVKSKQILPRPGASMVFDFTAPFLFGQNRFWKALSGLQYDPFTYASEAKRADHFVVHFSPYGLSRFVKTPLGELTGQIMDPGVIFGEDLHDLYEQIASADSLPDRVELIEAFLLKRYSSPTQSDMAVFAVSDQLRNELNNAGINAAKAQVSLSTRQVERKFKALIGVDMQSYIRISRFDYAKKLLLRNPSLRLTDVGLEAGYYDQPHFSNDFKQISGVRPGSLNIV